MPTGKPKCPVCHGNGTVKEDANEYEFVTRDPMTSKCLVCNGTGILNPSTKLPNGQRAFEVWREGRPVESQRRLNVSKKALVGDEDVSKRQDEASTMEVPDIGINRSVPDEMLKIGKQFEDLRRNEEIPVESFQRTHRQNEAIKSGKHFLVVTETEPYYMDVYMVIRAGERKQGTWSAEEEERYVSALEERYKAMKEVHNG